MQFHSYYAIFDMVMRLDEKDIKREERETGRSRQDIVYSREERGLLRQFAVNQDPDIARVVNRCHVERVWLRERRPYYAIYPGIVRYLSRTDLSKVPSTALKPPLPQLCLRFAQCDNPFMISFRDGPCKGQSHPLHAILVGERADTDTVGVGKGRALLTTFQWNPTNDYWSTSQIVSSVFLPDGATVEQCIEQLKGPLAAGDMELDSYIDCIRIVATTCLLSTDLEDSLVLPEVLRADEAKWVKTHDPKFLDRAKRKGLFGWTVGRELQVSPHWRSASPLALYWTGPGGKTPLYRYRRGTIVHRELVEKMPTGHEDVSSQP